MTPGMDTHRSRLTQTDMQGGSGGQREIEREVRQSNLMSQRGGEAHLSQLYYVNFSKHLPRTHSR